ncbi:MAG: hypothetical protein IBX61_08980 [Thermoleophilia bacterium]|nr:hypothetical protein [Thermoleophilia bacterium]
MGKKINKCKAPGCGKWVLHQNSEEFCPDHYRPDPISALYVDKTPEQAAEDERICEFFSYLLHNRSTEELLS